MFFLLLANLDDFVIRDLTFSFLYLICHQNLSSVNGGEEYISTHMQSSEDIKRWVEYMRSRSGYPVERLRKYQHTDHPSIQGPWNPWIHRDPQINMAEFPQVSH